MCGWCDYTNNSGFNTNNTNNSGYIWLYDGIKTYYIYIYLYLVGGMPTPLKNDGVRQREG